MRPARKRLCTEHAVHSMCHHCLGTGSVGQERAVAIRDQESPVGYQVHRCAQCDGERWLPGMQPPL